MSGRWPARMRRLPQADWPAADATAWAAASNPRPGPFSRNRRRSPATYRMYAEAYGGFLWHLQSEGQLDPAETPAERVTPARLDHYYERLVQSGCADYTLVTRFEALHGALRLMHPDRDFSFVTRPGGVSIRQQSAAEPARAVRAGFPACRTVGGQPCSVPRSVCRTRGSGSGRSATPP